MKIKDYISGLFNRSKNHVITGGGVMYVPDWELCKEPFGETIFLNVAQLLTDIYGELYWQVGKSKKAEAWRAWANENGQSVLLRLLAGDGFVVVGYRRNDDGTWSFYNMPKTAYQKRIEDDRLIVECYDTLQDYYVIASPTLAQTGKTDRQLCTPFIGLIDAALNGSKTTSERLGAYVVMTPETNDFGGVLVKEEKEELEKDLEKQYGSLRKQKQVMMLSRPMKSQVVSLANVDLRMQEKVKSGVLGIADRFKVPANQIAYIDSTSSKSLANGTELREGDMSKYRTFRRLVDMTLYKFAHDMGIFADYRLENEPKSVQGQTIENKN